MSRDAATSVRFDPADGELTVCVSHIEGLGRLAHGEELAALSVASELVASGICTDEGIPHEDVQGVAVVVGFPSTTFTIERHSDDARVSLRGWASPFGFVLAEENETPTGVMNFRIFRRPLAARLSPGISQAVTRSAGLPTNGSLREQPHSSRSDLPSDRRSPSST